MIVNHVAFRLDMRLPLLMCAIEKMGNPRNDLTLAMVSILDKCGSNGGSIVPIERID